MMASKTKGRKQGAPAKPDPATLQIDDNYVTPEDRERYCGTGKEGFEKLSRAMVARALAQPEVRAARAIQQFEGENLDINACAEELRGQVADVQVGKMTRPEAMLVSQAHALDALFSALAMRSKKNSDAGYLDAADRYLRLAFKAQSQCRTTLEALAEIKNPRPVAFVKQANIAHGPQQVNNGTDNRSNTHTPAHAREIESPANQLSGGAHELLPDARASGIASRVNSTLEAVGEIHRAADRGREG